jgi:hypothetical protein
MRDVREVRWENATCAFAEHAGPVEPPELISGGYGGDRDGPLQRTVRWLRTEVRELALDTQLSGLVSLGATVCQVVGRDRIACRLDDEPLSFCGTGPLPRSLTAAEDTSVVAFTMMGTEGLQVFATDEHPAGSMDLPFFFAESLALDEDVLLASDDGHLYAMRVPPLVGHVPPTPVVELAAWGTVGSFVRCDLGEARALALDDHHVLVGHGEAWEGYDVAPAAGDTAGEWSCTAGALHRIDHSADRQELIATRCDREGCVRSRLALEGPLANAPIVHATQLGEGVVALHWNVDGDLVLSASCGASFGPPRSIAAAGSGTELAAEARVIDGVLYVPLLTHAGPALLLVEAGGAARYVRPEALPSPAWFHASDVIATPDETVVVNAARLDEAVRVTLEHDDGVLELGRACESASPLDPDPALYCGAPTTAPVVPMMSPGAPSLVGSLDGYVDGGGPRLLDPTGTNGNRLATSPFVGYGFDATVYPDGITLGVRYQPYGCTDIVEYREGALVGCLAPWIDGTPLLDRWERDVRFVGREMLVLARDGLRIAEFALPDRLPHSEREDGETCEHGATPTLLHELTELSTHLEMCPLDTGPAFAATAREGEETVVVAVGISTPDGWTMHALDPPRTGVAGCMARQLTIVGIERGELSETRCDATGCTTHMARIPALIEQPAWVVDLGDRLAVLHRDADGALMARRGRLDDLSEIDPVVIVDARSDFRPVGSASITERAGAAFIVGRVPGGWAMLRLDAGGYAAPMPTRSYLRSRRP